MMINYKSSGQRSFAVTTHEGAALVVANPFSQTCLAWCDGIRFFEPIKRPVVRSAYQARQRRQACLAISQYVLHSEGF